MVGILFWWGPALHFGFSPYVPDKKNWFGFSSKGLTNGKISFSRYCNHHEYTTTICNVFEWMPEIWKNQLIPERKFLNTAAAVLTIYYSLPIWFSHIK